MKKNLYAQHRDWSWEIPAPDGQVDRVDILLNLGCRETLTVNGKVVSDRRVFKIRNEYRVPLSNGKEAFVTIRADWRKLGVPICELRVDGELCEYSLGPTKLPKADEIRIPEFTRSRRIAVAILEIYRTLFVVGLLLFPLKLLFHLQGRTPFPIYLFTMLWSVGIALQLQSRTQIFLKARSDHSSFLEEIHREDFRRIQLQLAQKQQYPINESRSLRHHFRIGGPAHLTMWGLSFVFGCAIISFGLLNEIQLPRALAIQRPLLKALVWMFVLIAPLRGLNAHLYEQKMR